MSASAGNGGSGLRYLSVCSGIEAAAVAWHPLGWRPVAFSEIQPFPAAVLAQHYPQVPNWGDMTRFKEWPDDTGIDLLVGGTPCQSFSVAGLRQGLDDPRGNLALVYLALADLYRPRWLVWENVPGVLSSNGGRDFGAIIGAMGQLGYGWAYRVLDAQFFGVPQRRRRVFLIGYLGDWRPATAVLFEPEGLRGDPPPRREAGEGIAPTISARPTGGGGLGTDFDLDGGLIAFGGNNTAGPIDVATAITAHGGPSGRLDFDSETFVAHALRGEGFDASEGGTGRGTPLTASSAGVRRLTPRECERLQGFPDDYTAIPWRGKRAPDGPRYKALGNSMAVPVMRWIGERINLYSQILPPYDEAVGETAT